MKTTLLVLLFLCFPLLAEKLDKSSQEALQQTMEILQSPQKRGAEIAKDPGAKAANAEVEALTGNAQNTQKLYELAALIMQNLTQQAAGDPNKMAKILEQMQKDPASFAATFTAEQQRLLKELGQDIEKNKVSKSIP